MKLALYIMAIFSFALVACTDRLPETAMPNVDNGAITMVKAEVKPLQLEGTTEVGNYQWSEKANIGIYGSAGVNELYRIVKSTTGDYEAYFYGNVVDGEMIVYMPYSSESGANALEGRVKMHAEQTYYPTALEHLMYNSAFLASTTTNEVVFDYYAGLVEISIEYDIQNIDYVKVKVANISKEQDYNDYVAGYLPILSTDTGVVEDNSSAEVCVGGVPEGVNASVSEPATLWAALAPGVYQNFVVEVGTKQNGSAVFPVEGPFEVKPRAIVATKCVVKKVDHNNGVGDFEGEEGEFN